MLLLSKKPTQAFVTPSSEMIQFPSLSICSPKVQEMFLFQPPTATTHLFFFLIWGVCVCGGGMCMWALWGQRHQIPWYLSHRWLWDAWCRDWELNSKLWENSMYFTRRDIRIGLISVLIKFHHFNAWAIYSRPRSSWIQALTSVSLIFLRASCHRVYS